MNPNQTIDGVPGLRSLIERVTSQDLGMSAKKDRAEAAHELRALLDAEPGTIAGHHPECRAVDDYKPGECSHNCKPATQPQGEPVYMVRSHGSCCWEEMRGENLEMCQAQPGEYEVRKLYAEQTAPVAQGKWEKMARLAAYYLSPAIVSHQWNMTDETRKEALGVCRAINSCKPEPVTTGYVQPVPDQCDRITWRGSYYHLPVDQRALVAVALPDRFKQVMSYLLGEDDLDGHLFRDLHKDGMYWWRRELRACLDELKRLNPSL